MYPVIHSNPLLRQLIAQSYQGFYCIDTWEKPSHHLVMELLREMASSSMQMLNITGCSASPDKIANKAPRGWFRESLGWVIMTGRGLEWMGLWWQRHTPDIVLSPVFQWTLSSS